MKLLTSLALIATIALPAAGQARQGDNFSWSGKIPAGRWLRIRNLNGGITVGQASGDNVEVTATKRWRRGDSSVVRVATLGVACRESVSQQLQNAALFVSILAVREVSWK